jgi:hypothetical protein
MSGTHGEMSCFLAIFANGSRTSASQKALGPLRDDFFPEKNITQYPKRPGMNIIEYV